MKCIRSICLLPVIILAFQGCKDTNNGGTISLKGRLLYDCSKRPHANESIQVKMSCSEGVNNKVLYENVGTGTTDAEGRFSITCENHGAVDALFFNGKAIISFIPGGDGQSYDLGNVYDQAIASALFKITFKQPRNDTFYLGKGGLPLASVYPASGVKYIKLQDSGALTGMWPFDRSWTYGYGNADFHNANNYKQILVDDAFKICDAPDTMQITLP